MTHQKTKQNDMQVSNEKVVAIHYTLTNNDGQVLDSSAGREPLFYLHGFGNLIPGMEEGLEGTAKGDKLSLKISPEKGYGLRDEEAVQQVPKSAFGGNDVQVGMQFRAGNEQGQYIVTVVEVAEETVTVDANHPLAGVELNFEVEVMDVREATSEELAHGHVHGPGGHNH
jgi:FKBP-type peptidyl-prolyl cis-trans isomerase SlyD